MKLDLYGLLFEVVNGLRLQLEDKPRSARELAQKWAEVVTKNTRVRDE